mmetsp:Transcript_41461/g.119503  ORF Transcript_41461/g.119503 Transcript_41461/m.119503 type:complete len:311 (+) Transcript_41461:421-1353(+)
MVQPVLDLRTQVGFFSIDLAQGHDGIRVHVRVRPCGDGHLTHSPKRDLAHSPVVVIPHRPTHCAEGVVVIDDFVGEDHEARHTSPAPVDATAEQAGGQRAHELFEQVLGGRPDAEQCPSDGPPHADTAVLPQPLHQQLNRLYLETTGAGGGGAAKGLGGLLPHYGMDVCERCAQRAADLGLGGLAEAIGAGQASEPRHRRSPHEGAAIRASALRQGVDGHQGLAKGTPSNVARDVREGRGARLPDPLVTVSQGRKDLRDDVRERWHREVPGAGQTAQRADRRAPDKRLLGIARGLDQSGRRLVDARGRAA